MSTEQDKYLRSNSVGLIVAFGGIGSFLKAAFQYGTLKANTYEHYFTLNRPSSRKRKSNYCAANEIIWAVHICYPRLSAKALQVIMSQEGHKILAAHSFMQELEFVNK